MNALLVYVHGWGFGRELWKPLQNLLGGIALDLNQKNGFTRGIKIAEPFLAKSSNPVIAVGHSLGFAWLLHHRPFAWHGIVSINGFARFTSADSFSEGVPSRVVRRMIAKCVKEPKEVRQDFLCRCKAGPERMDEIAADVLIDGLEALCEWDERESLANEAKQPLALAGRNDPIVSAALSEATFGFNGSKRAELHWQDSGHLLPISHPMWCAERIQKYAECVDGRAGAV